MSKRLQVRLDERELREIQRTARARRMTLAEWVRQALRDARRREPLERAEKRVEILRTAVRHHFPTGDVATMLAEIARGKESIGS